KDDDIDVPQVLPGLDVPRCELEAVLPLVPGRVLAGVREAGDAQEAFVGVAGAVAPLPVDPELVEVPPAGAHLRQLDPPEGPGGHPRPPPGRWAAARR